jgi:hypothetical protein
MYQLEQRGEKFPNLHHRRWELQVLWTDILRPSTVDHLLDKEWYHQERAIDLVDKDSTVVKFNFN